MVLSPVEQWSLIERLATAKGVTAEALRKWREPGRGVPHKFRLEFVREAAKAGIVLDDETFEHPPAKAPSEAA